MIVKRCALHALDKNKRTWCTVALSIVPVIIYTKYNTCFCLVDRGQGSVGDFGTTLFDACVVDGTASMTVVAPGTGEIKRSVEIHALGGSQCYKATA